MLIAVLTLSIAAAAPQAGLTKAPVGPLSYGTYDFEEGFRRTASAPRAAGPDVLFSTISCYAPYYGILANPMLKQEFVDEFGLPNRGVGGVETINRLTWAYCDINTLGYFDAVLSIYEDTTPGVGPSVWVPGVPSFADCTYLVRLPDSGCWNVSIDLSGGFECTVPQTGAPGAAFIGWSVTPVTTFYGGMVLNNQSCAGYGTVDSFEWRDWSGAYTGTPYTYRGSYFGGANQIRADFICEVLGTPEDVVPCYGDAPLDQLILQAMANAEPGSPLPLLIEDAPTGSRTYALLVARGGCTPSPMTSNFGAWTRMFSMPTVLTRTFSGSGPVISTTLPIPPGAPSNALASMQVVQLNGPISAAGVERASNGLEFYL